MACAITSLIMLAAIGVLTAGLKERPQVREDKTPNSSHSGPLIA